MKLRLMIAAVVASTALFAVDPTSDTFGMIRVNDNCSNTVIGVPWVNVGTTGNVTLSNLVSTATLAEGDKVYLFESETWYGYELNGSGEWEPMDTVSDNPNVSSGTPDPAISKTLARGSGLILERGVTNTPVYLCGRYTTDPVSTPISANTLTLIANPNPTAKVIPVGHTGDEIQVPLNGGGLQIYSVSNNTWYTEVETTTTQGERTKKVRTWTPFPNLSLAPGKGAWYKSGSTGTTINWNSND